MPYDRPPLSKAYLDEADAPVVVTFREEEHLRSDLGVDLVLSTPASGLDAAAREVLVDRRGIPYDSLVIVTGSRPWLLSGSEDLAGVHPLRTLDDAIAVRATLDAGARTVVTGAGSSDRAARNLGGCAGVRRGAQRGGGCAPLTGADSPKFSCLRHCDDEVPARRGSIGSPVPPLPPASMSRRQPAGSTWSVASSAVAPSSRRRSGGGRIGRRLRARCRTTPPRPAPAGRWRCRETVRLRRASSPA